MTAPGFAARRAAAQACERCVAVTEGPETADDQPRAVAVVRGRHLCGECAADHRAMDAAEALCVTVATALEASEDWIHKAVRKLDTFTDEKGRPDFLLLDPRHALATAAICTEAIRELEAARTAAQQVAAAGYNGDGFTPELTEAETLEVADAIMGAVPPAPLAEPINQFRERAARYAAKRGEG